MTFALQIQNLSRHFNDLVAVDNISFAIQQGEIFGLLGPNGAGKTTTLSMLATMLTPTSGSATVNGIDIEKDPDGVRKSIGIVFQDQSLDEELTAWENMDFHGRLYRIPKEIRNQRITELLTLVELNDRRDDIVKTFSGGMRRRLEIARGLLHHPQVLFLDEPTLGLDPQTRNHLWQYIATLAKEKGITIILTTHYMDEADRLCDRVAIIDHGRIIAIDTPKNLKDGLGGDLVTIGSPDPSAVAAALREPWVARVETHNDNVVVSLKNADQHVSGIVTLLNKRQIPITSITIHKPTLEDVFLSFTGRTIREQEAGQKETMRMHQRMMRHWIMDIIYTIWLRNMLRYIRSKSRIIGSISMPLFFLLFLGFGLNSVVQLPGLGGNYIVFLVPGMVAMSVMFTSVFSGIQIIWDKQFGFLKETLVAPVSRLEIMLGQTAGGATTAVLQGFMILVVSLFIGLNVSNAAGFLVALLFMVLIGISFTAFGIAIASRMEDMTGFQLIMNFVIFPIFGLSGALFPISSLPAGIKPITYIDPLTYGVEGIRYGLTGVSQISPVICFAVIGGFAAATTIIGAYLFRKIRL